MLDQLVNGPRDLKQVRNALQSVREENKLSPCEITNLYEMHLELAFVRELSLTPLSVTCFTTSKKNSIRN